LVLSWEPTEGASRESTPRVVRGHSGGSAPLDETAIRPRVRPRGAVHRRATWLGRRRYRGDRLRRDRTCRRTRATRPRALVESPSSTRQRNPRATSLPRPGLPDTPVGLVVCPRRSARQHWRRHARGRAASNTRWPQLAAGARNRGKRVRISDWIVTPSRSSI
jgi:hypothetical protein